MIMTTISTYYTITVLSCSLRYRSVYIAVPNTSTCVLRASVPYSGHTTFFSQAELNNNLSAQP